MREHTTIGDLANAHILENGPIGLRAPKLGVLGRKPRIWRVPQDGEFVEDYSLRGRTIDPGEEVTSVFKWVRVGVLSWMGNQ